MSTARLPRRSTRPREHDEAKVATVADLLKRLGDIPARRVRLAPTPGTAVEADLIRNNEGPFRSALCELVEGTLVEKPMGMEESEIASLIIMAVGNFVYARKLGMVLAPDGMLRLFPGLVRAPDVSFIDRRSYPGGKKPKGPIAAIAPNLAVEVLSRSNSKKEMEGKVRDYFAAGSRLVWLVDPRKKVVKVYTKPTEFLTLSTDDHVDGGDVLPGFRMAIKDLFDRD